MKQQTYRFLFSFVLSVLVFFVSSCLFGGGDKSAFIIKNETTHPVTIKELRRAVQSVEEKILFPGDTAGYSTVSSAETVEFDITCEFSNYTGNVGYIQDYSKFTLIFYENTAGELVGEVKASFFGKPESHPAYIRQL